VLLLVLAAGPWCAPRPPEARGPDASDVEFSADRAHRWVERLASAPRPMGSPAHAAARDLLIARLRQLGLEVEVQERTVATDRFSARSGNVVALRAKNIVGTLRGVDPLGAVLLSAHYDSHPTTPGAADDAMGVAAILEAVRALRAGPPLRHDLVVLFTDAEEVGLVGARAFAAESRNTAPIKAFLNFDARGNASQVTMFRATSPDAAFVRMLDDHVPTAFSTSFAAAVARLLPNDTDFTELAAAGLPGMDFANTGGWARYHAPTDTPSALDRGTLQQHGDYALGVARALASLPDFERLTSEGDACWFISGPVRLRHPRSWELPLAALVLFVSFGAAFGPFAKGRRGAAGVGAAFVLSALVVSGLVAWAVVSALWSMHPEFALVPSLSPSVVGAVLAACAGIAVNGVAVLGRMRLASILSGAEVAGVSLVWSILGLAVAAFVPGASMIFVLPAAILVVASVVSRRAPGLAIVVQVGAAIAVLVFWRPVLSTLADVFGLARPVVFTLLSALAATTALGPLAAVGSVRLASFLVNVLPFAALVVAHVTPAFDAAHPRPVSLSYAFDADLGEASVVSLDAEPDSFVDEQVDGHAHAGFPSAAEPFAPVSVAARRVQGPALVTPGASITKDESGDGRRRLLLRVVPPSGAGSTVVAVQGDVAAARVDQVLLPPGSLATRPLVWFGDDPFDLAIETTETRPLAVKFATRTPGLPDGLVPPLPANLMSAPANALPPRDPLRWSGSSVVTVSRTF